MSVEVVRNALLCCFLINAGVLVVWFLLFAFAHDWEYRLAGRFGLRLSVEQFDLLNAAVFALYRMGIIIFNLAPYIALWIVG